MAIINKDYNLRANPVGPTALQHIGPILAVEVHIPDTLAQMLAANEQAVPSSVTGRALIDTGASQTCVDSAVIKQLGISPIGVMELATANGLTETSQYPAKLRLLEGNLDHDCEFVVAVNLEGQFVGGEQIIALIGRDILRQCIFIYNGLQGAFSLASS